MENLHWSKELPISHHGVSKGLRAFICEGRDSSPVKIQKVRKLQEDLSAGGFPRWDNWQKRIECDENAGRPLGAWVQGDGVGGPMTVFQFLRRVVLLKYRWQGPDRGVSVGWVTFPKVRKVTSSIRSERAPGL